MDMDVDAQNTDTSTDSDDMDDSDVVLLPKNHIDKFSQLLANFLRDSQIDQDALSLVFDKPNLTLIDTFNRVLYSNKISKDAKTSSPVFSLISLCCKAVTRDAKLLKEECTYLPTNRYHILLREAMRTDSHESVAVLMSTWPFSSISVAEIMPDVTVDERILFEKQSKFQHLSKIIKKFMRCLLLFLDILKTDSTSHLKILDLRGMPMGDRVMNYLIRESKTLSTNLSPPHDYHVIIDCVICTVDTANQLISFIKLTNDSQIAKLQLHISKLDVSHLNPTKNWELLQLINPTELLGLSVQIDFATDFYPAISTRFPNLTSLEITGRGHFQELLANQIQPLQIKPHLRRLGLHCRRHQLHTFITSNILTDLEFLDISDRKSLVPNSAELQLLTNVPLNLYQLNLDGYFIVEGHVNLWSTLLTSVAPTLRILNWERCLISILDFPLLLSCVLLLYNLQYLNLSQNAALMRAISARAPALGSMAELRCVRLPYIDEELIEDFTPDDISAYIWREIIEQQFAAAKTPPATILWEQFVPELW